MEGIRFGAKASDGEITKLLYISLGKRESSRVEFLLWDGDHQGARAATSKNLQEFIQEQELVDLIDELRRVEPNLLRTAEEAVSKDSLEMLHWMCQNLSK